MEHALGSSSNDSVYTLSAKPIKIYGHDECLAKVTTLGGVFRTPRCIIRIGIYRSNIITPRVRP